MKIKLSVSRSGPSGSFSAGDVIDVSTDEAQRMIEAGQGVAVRSEKRETTKAPLKREKAIK